MSDLHTTPPRVFLIRHGETAWTISGQQTGRTDIPLTLLGERQVASTGASLVGEGKLLDPTKIRKVWVSPRRRALKTFQILFARPGAAVGEDENQSDISEAETTGIRGTIFGGGSESIVITEDIREWDYGEYEGLRPEDVRELRTTRGLDIDEQKWNIWRDGCEGGESKEDVAERLDRLIKEVKEVQRPYLHQPGCSDVVLVAHGLILRCFFKRWLNLPIDHPFPMTMPPGALAVLSYRNFDINQPSFHMGIAIPASR